MPIARPSTRPTKRDTVTTASLLRGRVYVYMISPEVESIRFEKDKPPTVLEDIEGIATEDLAAELEQLYETVTASDGESFDKPIFEVLRGQPRPDNEEDKPRTVRRIVSVEVARPQVKPRPRPITGSGLSARPLTRPGVPR